jgi:hypothetical protein
MRNYKQFYPDGGRCSKQKEMDIVQHQIRKGFLGQSVNN